MLISSHPVLSGLSTHLYLLVSETYWIEQSKCSIGFIILYLHIRYILHNPEYSGSYVQI